MLSSERCKSWNSKWKKLGKQLRKSRRKNCGNVGSTKRKREKLHMTSAKSAQLWWILKKQCCKISVSIYLQQLASIKTRTISDKFFVRSELASPDLESFLPLGRRELFRGCGLRCDCVVEAFGHICASVGGIVVRAVWPQGGRGGVSLAISAVWRLWKTHRV